MLPSLEDLGDFVDVVKKMMFLSKQILDLKLKKNAIAYLQLIAILSFQAVLVSLCHSCCSTVHSTGLPAMCGLQKLQHNNFC